MSGALYDYVETTGVISTDTNSLLTEVNSEWTGALGTGLNVNQTGTPQDIMIAAEVAARDSVIANNAQVANQINPSQAEGLFLDAICALTGLQRAASTYTTIEGVLLAGVQGSPIAAGTQFKNVASGALFATNTDVILDPVTGQATVNATATVTGPVAAPVGSGSAYLPVSDVLGWETVTVPIAGVQGTAQQSDAALRLLRQQTLSLQNVALIDSAVSALSDLPGVIGVSALENVSDSTQTIDTITMISHSVWFCVDGGAQSDIAFALLENKSNGAGWNGAQTVSVVEPISGQTYTVMYDVPTDIPILVAVTCMQGTYVGDPAIDVVSAVLAYGSNQVAGLQGLTLATSVSPFEIAAAIQMQLPGIFIQSVTITVASSVNYQPTEIAMNVNQKATIGSGAVTVTVNG